MTKFDIDYRFQVYAETPTAAFAEIAARMMPKVVEYLERVAIAAAPEFDRLVPSGCTTGEEHRIFGDRPPLPGWMCVVSIKEHE